MAMNELQQQEALEIIAHCRAYIVAIIEESMSVVGDKEIENGQVDERAYKGLRKANELLERINNLLKLKIAH